MKKRIYAKLTSCKYVAIILLGILFASNTSAQILVRYPLTSKTTPNLGPNPAPVTGVTAGLATVGLNVDNGGPNSQGLKIKTIGNDDAGNSIQTWPSHLQDSFSVSFPISPAAGYDIHLTQLQFTDTTGGTWGDPGTLEVQAAYQVDGGGPWVPLGAPVNLNSGTPATPITINASDVFYNTHSYVVRLFFYSTDGSTKGNYIRFADFVVYGTTTTQTAGPGTVTTLSATATGKYTATLAGSYQFGNQYYFATQSGMIWSTSSTNLTTALSTKTTNGANGVINNNITGLTAGTQYYAVAYIVTQFGVKYGAVIPFKTDPPSLPIVTLNITSVLSNKAGATGNVTDSGGLVISEKGFVWNKTGGPTTGSNQGKAYEGSGTQSFSDFVKGLQPNTHYCVRAYAINSLGTGYSQDSCFTTAAPAPTLTAIPGSIDFGENFYGGSALILSYTLTGSDLNGVPITIQAPPGFIIATSPSGIGTVTGNQLTISYTGSTLNPTLIYVEMPTTAYGTFAGNITHSGGGVAGANADMVALTGDVVQSPIDVSNTGTDFWLGYAFEQKMSQKTSSGGANMYVYISGAPGTVATVEMPLLSTPFTQTVTIPASGFTSVTGLPQGDPNDPTNAAGLPDARLYYSGVTNRGIHVYSHSGPISVWLYDYATNNSAGGALIFPTNTWNSSYTVQAYGNTTNTGPPNSFFFVIADVDNTPVYFTPSVDIIDSTTSAGFTGTSTDNAGNLSYKAGVTDTIYLNKGQVFNAMGAINTAGFGLDLSGTLVRTDCDKKIAVFGGNGRCLVTTPVTCPNPSAGSDNMVQQMVPSVAWDTKYFTVPTKSMAHNLYRIYVKSAATQVWINDTTHGAASKLSTAITTPGAGTLPTFSGNYSWVAFSNGNGGYYQLETSYPMDVESDLPINITQFMTSCSGNTAIGNNGSGDPEMIILTGAQQAINNATVFSPIFQDGAAGGAYINIVIPKAGVSTFKLDNAATVDTGTSTFTGTAYGAAPLIPIANAFKPYPSNPNFYFATFHVSYPAVHTMSSSVPFNGIAYGGANGESYGFNAGTQVKDLNAIFGTNNPNGKDSSATAVRTCVGNLVTLKLALPYLPSQVDSIVWDPEGDNRIQPTAAMKGALSAGKAKYDSTILVQGRTFYSYSSPVQYTFGQLGTYRFPVKVYGTFASDCPGESIINMVVIVGHDQDNITFVANCGNPTVAFDADTIPMAGTNITKWIWDFGDNNTVIDGPLATSHTYGTTQLFTAKLTTYNSVGCISTDSVQVDFAGGLKAGFTTSTNSTCAGNGITFTDNSTSAGVSGTPNKWVWDFLGDGSATITDNGTVSPHTFVYTTAGKYVAKLTVTSTSNCTDIFTDTVIIEATPVAAFTAAEVCVANATTFTNQSSVPGGLGTIDSSFWDYGDGTKDTTLGLASASHMYATPGSYTVSLSVKSDGGCTSIPVTHTATVDALPTAGFKLDVDCATQLVTFTDTSNANGGTIKEWDWTFGDGNDTTTTTAGISFKHFYLNGNGQSFTVSLTVKTQAGCSNTTAPQTFGIGAAPNAQFTLAPGTLCLPDASVTFNNTSSISDGSTNSMYYVWHFGDNTPDSTVSPGAPAPVTHIYTGVGPYTVTLTAFSNKGCTNTTSLTLNSINPQPVAVITAPSSTCINDSILLSANTAQLWDWDFGDHVGTSSLQTPKYKWNAPGKYGVTLVITSAQGCKSAPATDSITVNDLPVANFTVQSGGLCAKSSISFTDASTTPAGSTITEWDWDFGDGNKATVTGQPNGNVTHTYAAAGNHNVTLSIKNSNGCINILPFSLSISISPLPNPNFTVSSICLPPGNAVFTNTSTISSGTIDELTFTDFGDATSGAGDATPGGQTTHTYNFLTGGVYNVKLEAQSGAGCIADTTIPITIYNVPTAQDSILNASALCSSQPVKLINQSLVNGYGSVSKIAIYWDFANETTPDEIDSPVVVNGQYQHQYPVLPTNTQYTVVVNAFSGNGCPGASASTTITVLASPDAKFNQPAAVCADVAPFLLTYGFDQNNLGGKEWYSGPGVEPDSVTFSPALAGPGTHTLIFTTTNGGCSDTAQQHIVVNPIPAVDYGPTVSVLEGDSVVLTPVSVSDSNLHYLWSPPLYLNSDTLSSPTSKPAADVTYTITLTSGIGCQSTSTLLVQVLKDFTVPNTFTPNGDGINDKWNILNLSKYPIQWVQVFDRYGQLLYESHEYSEPWDGTYKGKPLPAGTYYYIIELNGLRTPKTGYVTILR